MSIRWVLGATRFFRPSSHSVDAFSNRHFARSLPATWSWIACLRLSVRSGNCRRWVEYAFHFPAPFCLYAGRLCVCGGHRYPYAGLVGSAAFEVSVMLVFLRSSSSSVFRQARHWLSMTRLWLYTTDLAARQAGHTSRTPRILHLGMGTGQGIKSIANESIAVGFSI